MLSVWSQIVLDTKDVEASLIYQQMAGSLKDVAAERAWRKARRNVGILRPSLHIPIAHTTNIYTLKSPISN